MTNASRGLFAAIAATARNAPLSARARVLTMKTGRTLTELATEIERQSTSKKDFIADSRRLSFEASPNQGIILQGVNGGMVLKPIAHAQMAAALQIPKPYYDRCLTEAPDLLARNVNVWLAKQPAKKLIRTLDNEVRAVLSDSYRPLDNLDLAEAVLPKLLQLGARVESAEVTENRFYLKAVTERIQGQVKVGDVLYAGLVVSNSEVGQGSLKVEEMDFRLVCLNGMIRSAAIRKAHLGRSTGRGDAIEDAFEFFRTETRIADDRAFFLKVQDATASMFNQDRFTKRIQQYQEASATVIEADPVKVVEFTAKRFNLNEGEQSSVMRHLIQGGDLSVWGLGNAVTRASQDADSYDRATELESIGGDIIELPKSAWTIKATKPTTLAAV